MSLESGLRAAARDSSVERGVQIPLLAEDESKQLVCLGVGVVRAHGFAEQVVRRIQIARCPSDSCARLTRSSAGLGGVGGSAFFEAALCSFSARPSP